MEKITANSDFFSFLLLAVYLGRMYLLLLCFLYTLFVKFWPGNFFQNKIQQLLIVLAKERLRLKALFKYTVIIGT